MTRSKLDPTYAELLRDWKIAQKHGNNRPYPGFAELVEDIAPLFNAFLRQDLDAAVSQTTDTSD